MDAAQRVKSIKELLHKAHKDTYLHKTSEYIAGYREGLQAAVIIVNTSKG